MNDLRGRYSVIYADPPWRFATFSRKGEGRSAAAHYECMPFGELCELPVSEHAAADCALFLWATDPLLPKALKLIEAWGFTYKTVAFYWAKLNRNSTNPTFCEGDFFTGMGYWTRANVEQCLLATIGRPQRLSMAVRRLIIAPRREHSRKPNEAYTRIEELVAGPYLELFARNSRLGWTAWGNQVELLDEGHVPIRRFPPTVARRGCLQRDLLDGN